MTSLLQQLMELKELQELSALVQQEDGPALVTGLSPVHRAMTAAALAAQADRPLLMLCADERECTRMAQDLQTLLHTEPVILPSREMQLHPTAAASREWEYRRLQALYRMGESRVVVTTAEALAQRCIPAEILRQTVFTLAVGQQHDIAALVKRLVAAGYSRSDVVEGPGQFALRGGILDVFSPHAEHPVRCEFFDDEIDAMGVFDTTTQRRIHNISETLLLSAGEVLPYHSEQSAENAAKKLEAVEKKLQRKQGSEALRQTLHNDIESLRQGTSIGCDRLLCAVYDQRATALDYLPKEMLVCVSESSRVSEALKGWLWQLKEDITTAVESGSHLTKVRIKKTSGKMVKWLEERVA